MSTLQLYLLYLIVGFGVCSPLKRVVPDYRLSDSIWPLHYEIQIQPYLLDSDGDKQFKFDGEVWITLQARTPNLNEIVLHAKGIEFRESEFYRESDPKKLRIKRTKPHSTTDKFSIYILERPLEENVPYVLHFVYRGVLGDDMNGFYKSNYVNSKGNTVWIGVTQFQPYFARKAFPCFDEPKYKATFKVKIICSSIYTAISNTNVEQQIKQNDKIITIFKKTPIMSTYLLAFVVSDFRTRNSGNNLFIIARPEAYNQTEYAATIGPKLLQILEKYTNYPYSAMNVEKMHLAGIPDFEAGAMENWGLITYRETYLLYDPNDSTLMDQQRIATVLSHELTHMWFGNLVTCDWWSYTWLNEGFAKYFEYFATHEIEPSWELDKQFVIREIHTVLQFDSLFGTNPLSDKTVASPTDIRKIFNSISYSKGAAIIRMIIHTMGDDNFRKAIRAYLRKYAYQTSVPENLFAALEEEWHIKGINLAEFLVGWTEEVGYPVVTINRHSDGKTIKISQKRFLLRPDAGSHSLRYTIPFTYTTNNEKNFENTTASIFLLKTNAEQTFILPKASDWIIGNIQLSGYYRVNYDKQTWNNIIIALKTKNFDGIHEINRANIVDDVFNFGRAELMNYSLIMPVLAYLNNEVNFLPWFRAFIGYNMLSIRLGKEYEFLFKKYINRQLERVYKHVGFRPEPGEYPLVTYNRISVLSVACRYGYGDCIEQSKIYFANVNIIPVDIRSVVYCTAMREGGIAEFEKLWNKFEMTNIPSERVDILTAIGCTKKSNILITFLNLILSSKVRLQDKLLAYSTTYLHNTGNEEIVFEFSAQNLQKMFKEFGSQNVVASLFSSMAYRFSNTIIRDKFKTFIDDNGHQFGVFVSKLKGALMTLDYDLKWSDNNLDTILEHISDEAFTKNMKTCRHYT